MNNHLENQRFVAHIDILGMSALVSRDPEQAWELLTGLVTARKTAHHTKALDISSATEIDFSVQVHAVTFSDTVLLFTKGHQDTDLRAILFMATEILSQALRLCVPIRIGISVGTFFFNLDESMYVGPALIEAYQIGEKAQWIGITTSAEVYRRTKENNLTTGSSDAVISTEIPHSDGNHSGYAVNWPTALRTSINAPLPITTQQLYSGFEQYFGKWESLPDTVKVKYDNTVHFINTFGE